MPIYEYQCQSCGHAFETMQRLADAPLTECPQCKGSLKKLISAPAFQFKGSGWYVTDYSRSGGGGGTDKGPGDASAKSEGAGKSEGGSEAKSGESSATKVETPSASPKPSSTSD